MGSPFSTLDFRDIYRFSNLVQWFIHLIHPDFQRYSLRTVPNWCPPIPLWIFETYTDFLTWCSGSSTLSTLISKGTVLELFRTGVPLFHSRLSRHIPIFERGTLVHPPYPP